MGLDEELSLKRCYKVKFFDKFILLSIKKADLFSKGLHTNRFFHAKRPMDVWGGGGGKRTGRFQKFCFINISPENFLQETLFCSFRLLYIYIVNVKEFR